MPAGEVNRIDVLCRQFKNVKTYFQPYEIRDADRFPITGHVSIATYARVFLTDLLPASWEKVIYLDCDLIVRRRLRRHLGNRLDGHRNCRCVREPGSSRHAELEIPESAPLSECGRSFDQLDLLAGT